MLIITFECNSFFRPICIHYMKHYFEWIINYIVLSFQRLSSGAWPTNSKVKRIRICFVHKKGGGRKCDCPNEWTMARLKIDPNQLGNTKATNQSKWWYVSFRWLFFYTFRTKLCLKIMQQKYRFNGIICIINPSKPLAILTSSLENR